MAQGDGTYALKGGQSGKYCADDWDQVVCDRDFVGTHNGKSWEKFEIEAYGTMYNVKWYLIKGGRSKKYCTYTSGKIVCNADSIGTGTMFALEPIDTKTFKEHTARLS